MEGEREGNGTTSRLWRSIRAGIRRLVDMQKEVQRLFGTLGVRKWARVYPISEWEHPGCRVCGLENRGTRRV